MRQIVIGGVGGQGIVSLGHVILQAAIKMGYNVRGVETHGLAQRGGSVVFHVRIGDFRGALVPHNGADILVSLEVAETLRYLPYLKPKGTIIMSTRVIEPDILLKIDKKYPKLEQIYQSLKKKAKNIIAVPTEAIARKIGNPRAENLIALGTLVGYDSFLDEDVVKNVISQRWPRFKEENLEAFNEGLTYGKNPQLAGDLIPIP